MDLLKIASLLDKAADDIEMHVAQENFKKANVDIESDSVKQILSGKNLEAIKIASELYTSNAGASIAKNVQEKTNKADRYADYDNKLLSYRG